ncbi:unnamed protein product, partial [Rotaria sp. Silwood1]
MGSVCFQMHDYSAALSYYKEALEIYQENLPRNHPDLVVSYMNIGDICDQMGDLSKAHSFYKSACEMEENLFP